MGSLSQYLVNWQELSSSPWVLSVIRSGFRLPWGTSKAPLSTVPVSFPPPHDLSARAALNEEVASLLQKQAIEEVICHSSPGFYGRIFVVPKASGGWRPVLDLSSLNTYLTNLRFRMETPSSIRDSIHRRDWAVSIDLLDAYFHILIHRKDRKFLRFVWAGKVFQFRALPFGLAPAPWLFSKIARELAVHVRGKGIRLRMYLDDWLLLAASRRQCLEQLQLVLGLCQQLGFVLNRKKSELIPAQRFIYLGMEFDTVAWFVRPSPARILRLNANLFSLRSAQQATARQLASLLGVMESLAPLLALGRLQKREFQREFQSRFSQKRESWRKTITLIPWLAKATKQWTDQVWLTEGVPLTPPPHEEVVFTDASTQGWGGHSGNLTASGRWNASQQSWHINRLELEAVALSMKEFLPRLRGKRVLINTDNTTVACYINRQGGTHSQQLSLSAEALLLWCQKHAISLTAKYVPGSLNVLADVLSRAHMVVSSEWTLTPDVLEPVWRTWFKPQIDLFATKFSKRLELYISPVPDPEAWGVDALSIRWDNLVGYAFPPLALMEKVLRKAREEGAKMILIAPLWPSRPWFPELRGLTHIDPLKLRINKRSLIQPRSGIVHREPEVLNLHAWMLCGNRCDHEEHPKRLQI